MKNAKQYSHFAVIYNPNSTGDAPAIAKGIRTELKQNVDSNKIVLLPTEQAGHAIELAKEATEKYRRPLIISVSGDGGYNEVINGVLLAEEGKSVVTVIGAGNANDHYRVVHKQRTITQMLSNEASPIDLIKVTIKNKNNQICKFAHSYVGIGLTPLIAEELNRNKLNLIKEFRIIVKALVSIRPTKIEHEGKEFSVDSLVFANISQMAKVLTLTDDNSLHDGMFEVVEIPHTSVLGLLRTLLIAATSGLKKQPKQNKYTFTLLEDHPLQVDGEIVSCNKGDEIKIEVAKSAITVLR